MNEWLEPGWVGFRSKDLRGPDPVGAKPMRTLRAMADAEGGWIPAEQATAQIERLRRSGYAVVIGGGAFITDAGRALLSRQPEVDNEARENGGE